MPFSPPFRTGYQQGDLIYGLAPVRPKLMMQRLAPDILNTDGICTVDNYRKSLISIHTKEVRATWKAFLLENERHKDYGVYAQAIRAYNNDEEKFAEHAPESLKNAAWRAKSKFGIEWTIKQQRGHIHFVLDEIDMGAVVTKTHTFYDANGTLLAQDMPRGKASAGAEKERTITHSELRWIYRNRNNPLVQERVQFWQLAGFIRPCRPPWEIFSQFTSLPSGKLVSWGHAWRIYRPKDEPAAFA